MEKQSFELRTEFNRVVSLCFKLFSIFPQAANVTIPLLILGFAFP